MEIQDYEISYTFSRSSKPGGQNVNKVSTRVTLLFDVEASQSLSDRQRDRIGEKLASRIGKDGVLRVVSQKYRTQKANREAALERFVALLAEALKSQRRRRPTAVPGKVREGRLEAKKRRGRIKRERVRPSADSD
ncbi:alternative ribosome rescue aminoacyl-tRNA hydrolase ArfB [Candidatus Eisenbacteria bacterium]|uniref:Alternative ribosome rescue aminoacyl-tRNA hydrolase ArfB n=1 Tax=Eiseniibacteriota bacterium TaxID=2212470 RepID=A0ABV6YQH3_UNCEI